MSELKAKIWAVVAYDRVLVENLPYHEAHDYAARSRRLFGVACCVVTNDVAERMKARS